MQLVLSFAALFAAVALLQLSSGGLGPLDALSGLALGFGTTQVGLLGSAHFVGFFIGCWWAPRLMGAVGHARAFAACTAAGAMGVIGHTLVLDPYAWALMRVASGLCVAGCYTVIESWLQAYVADEGRGRAFSTYRTVDLGAALVAQGLIGVLAPLDLYVAYNILALLCCASLLPLTLTRVRQPEMPRAPRLRPRLALARSPLAALAVVVAGLTGSSYRMVGPIYGQEVGLKPDQIGLFLAAFVAGGVLGQIPTGWIADRYDRRWVLIALGAASAGACGAMVSASAFGPSGAIAASLLFGAASFPVYSVAAAHAHDFAASPERVELSAALLFWFAVGAIASPLAASWLIERQGPAALFGLIAAAHLALIVMGLARMGARAAERRTAYVYAPRTSFLIGRLMAPRRERARPGRLGPARPDPARPGPHRPGPAPALPSGPDPSAVVPERIAGASGPGALEGADPPRRPGRAMPRTLITSALPYINGIKHLGNLVGSQLPADLHARYRRARGDEVLFLCATDEHGTPAELAAAKAGLPVAEYCAAMHGVQSRLAQGFRLSFDHYGRSSSPQNHRLTQHFAGRLHEAGLIEEVMERQVYSHADGRFLPDRYIEGTCPNCGYGRARGDQCENCTKQLDPTDLIEPRSAISGSTDLEVRETAHLYLRQSALAGEIEAWIDAQSGWPLLTTSIARKWLHDGDGLRDRSITRDLDWGIPVRRGTRPWPGMEGKVFYVWFDAPIEYIACAAEWAEAKGLPDEAWRRWWRTDAGAGDVRYVQFMGKDNVPFHTLSFPATLIGSGEPWKRADTIKAFNYLTYDGGQFSTSQGRGVFMDQALEILPADYWRWWLLSNAPEGGDAEFTWEGFQAGVNKDLADVLGNFVSRVTKLARARLGETVPEGGEWGAPEEALAAEMEERLRAYQAQMDAIEVRKAARALRAIWVAGNEYLQAAAPWAVLKTDPARAAMQIRLGLNLIALHGVLSAPFIPDASAALLRAMGREGAPWPASAREALTTLPPGHPFAVPETLFAKIDDATREAWRARFEGVRA